jgi:hypothetical protein
MLSEGPQKNDVLLGRVAFGFSLNAGPSRSESMLQDCMPCFLRTRLIFFSFSSSNDKNPPPGSGKTTVENGSSTFSGEDSAGAGESARRLDLDERATWDKLADAEPAGSLITTIAQTIAPAPRCDAVWMLGDD